MQQDMTKIFFVLRNLKPIKLTHKLSKRQQTIYSNIIVLKEFNTIILKIKRQLDLVEIPPCGNC